MRFYKKISIHFQTIPLHVSPSASSSYPCLHWQTKEPNVFLQVALPEHGEFRHSFTSIGREREQTCLGFAVNSFYSESLLIMVIALNFTYARSFIGRQSKTSSTATYIWSWCIITDLTATRPPLSAFIDIWWERRSERTNHDCIFPLIPIIYHYLSKLTACVA